MFAEVIRIDLDLEVRSPFHLGTGNYVPFQLSEAKRNELELKGIQPEAAELMRCYQGRPYIPGSSLKGALRAICVGAQSKEEFIDYLFGTAKYSDTSDAVSGYAGLMTVFGATTDSKSVPNVSEYPYGEGRGDGTFIVGRTRIDASTGTADTGGLFYTEMAAHGLAFKTKLELRRPYSLNEDENRWREAKKLFFELVKTIVENGVCLGKGTGKGQGELSVSVESDYQAELGKANLLEASVDRRDFKLVCSGPFLSIDSSHSPDASGLKAGEEGRFSVTAQRQTVSQPLLNGTSIIGKLRSEYKRLLILESLKTADPKSREAIEDDVALVFGKTDQASKIRLSNLRVGTKSQPIGVTQLALDRVSGAGLPSMLVQSEVFCNVQLEFSLQSVADENTGVLDKLDEHVKAYGLELGASSSRGFGWFEVGGEDHE